MLRGKCRAERKPPKAPPWPPRGPNRASKSRQPALHQRPRARKPKPDPMMDYLRSLEPLTLGDIGFGPDDLDALLTDPTAA